MKPLFMFLALMLSFGSLSAQNQKVITLPNHVEKLNMDVIQAFLQRRTVRNFANKEINPIDLSDILWAANGINRKSGKRTAPSAYGRQYIEIYVVNNHGGYLYDAVKNRLILKNNKTEKEQLSGQGHVSQASHVIVLIADMNRVPGGSDTKMKWAAITAGTIAQNIYLMSAAKGIGTCLVGSINSDEIKRTLGLSNEEVPILIMPLGYPGK